MYKGIMFGDSVGHGSLGAGRLNPTPTQAYANTVFTRFGNAIQG